jgi:hypothetical protein
MQERETSTPRNTTITKLKRNPKMQERDTGTPRNTTGLALLADEE